MANCAASPSNSTIDMETETTNHDCATDVYSSALQRFLREACEAVSMDHSYDAVQIQNLPLSEFVHVSSKDPLDNSISSSSWKCPICDGVPRTPVTLRDCGHLGCRKCFLEHLVSGHAGDTSPIGSKPCPRCQTLYWKDRLITHDHWPLFARQVWEMLAVKCADCDFVDNPITVTDHERRKCAKRRVVCPGCAFVGRVEDTIKHASGCKSLMMYCVGCGYPILYQNHSTHDCAEIQQLLQRLPQHARSLKPGPRGSVASTCTMSCETWKALHSFIMSPTTPDGQPPTLAYPSMNTSTPPAARPPTTMATVERLRRNRDGTPPPRRYRTPPDERH